MGWQLCEVMNKLKVSVKAFFSPKLKVMASAERKLKQMPSSDTLGELGGGGGGKCKGEIDREGQNILSL